MTEDEEFEWRLEESRQWNWTTPVEPRKTLRETNPLDQTPRYPDAAMETTSFGFRVPRHVLVACGDAYFDAVDRMRAERERQARRENRDRGGQERLQDDLDDLEPKGITPTVSDETGPTGRSKPRLLGWDPPPPDHVEAYLRAGGS